MKAQNRASDCPANGEFVDKVELARRTCHSTRAIVELQKKGLPFIRVGPRKNIYHWDSVRAWFLKRQVQVVTTEAR